MRSHVRGLLLGCPARRMTRQHPIVPMPRRWLQSTSRSHGRIVEHVKLKEMKTRMAIPRSCLQGHAGMRGLDKLFWPAWFLRRVERVWRTRAAAWLEEDGGGEEAGGSSRPTVSSGLCMHRGHPSQRPVGVVSPLNLPGSRLRVPRSSPSLSRPADRQIRRDHSATRRGEVAKGKSGAREATVPIGTGSYSRRAYLCQIWTHQTTAALWERRNWTAPRSLGSRPPSLPAPRDSEGRVVGGGGGARMARSRWKAPPMATCSIRSYGHQENGVQVRFPVSNHSVPLFRYFCYSRLQLCCPPVWVRIQLASLMFLYFFLIPRKVESWQLR
jgi:hypothetical protein